METQCVSILPRGPHISRDALVPSQAEATASTRTNFTYPGGMARTRFITATSDRIDISSTPTVEYNIVALLTQHQATG